MIKAGSQAEVIVRSLFKLFPCPQLSHFPRNSLCIIPSLSQITITIRKKNPAELCWLHQTHLQESIQTDDNGNTLHHLIVFCCSYLIGQPLTLSSNNGRLRSKGSADSLLPMKIGPGQSLWGVYNDVGSRHQLLTVNLCCPCTLFNVRTSIFGDQSRLISDISVEFTQTCGRVRCAPA